jgi:hypothetical protein
MLLVWGNPWNRWNQRLDVRLYGYIEFLVARDFPGV